MSSVKARLNRLEAAANESARRCPHCPPTPPFHILREGEEAPPEVVCQVCGRPALGPGELRGIRFVRSPVEPDPRPIPQAEPSFSRRPGSQAEERWERERAEEAAETRGSACT
jgi:hypothetical protein